MNGGKIRQNGENNAMKRIESGIKHIPYSQESVYAKVSELSNLKTLLDRIPKKRNIKSIWKIWNALLTLSALQYRLWERLNWEWFYVNLSNV